VQVITLDSQVMSLGQLKGTTCNVFWCIDPARFIDRLGAQPRGSVHITTLEHIKRGLGEVNRGRLMQECWEPSPENRPAFRSLPFEPLRFAPEAGPCCFEFGVPTRRGACSRVVWSIFSKHQQHR